MGFKCSESLLAFGTKATLADVCCATCSKTGKPKTTTAKKLKACGAPSYKGDGNCDDNNNHAGCAWDGGDCCYKSVKGGVVKKTYCKKVR